MILETHYYKLLSKVVLLHITGSIFMYTENKNHHLLIICVEYSGKVSCIHNAFLKIHTSPPAAPHNPAKRIGPSMAIPVALIKEYVYVKVPVALYPY